MDNAFARMNVPHLVRFLLLNTAIFFGYLAFLVPGVVWQMNINEKTGYRKIDFLFIVIPFASIYVLWRTQWRYCSSVKYWEPAPVATVDEPVLVSVA